MCLKATGIEPLEGVTRTGFYDDSEIADWAKPYISTALMAGIVQGHTTDDGKTVFSPDAPITYAQACVMLDNILDISDVTSAGSISQELCPAWAYQATVNLAACDIVTASSFTDSEEPLTRAQAAQMIQNAIALMDERDEGFSLLSWAE